MHCTRRSKFQDSTEETIIIHGGASGGVSIMASGGAEDQQAVHQFQLSPSSTLVKILRGKIAQWSVDGSSDAIVNPTNERMLGGGGTDGAIHRAAGPQLREACYKVPEARPGIRCPTGQARITPGFKLAASHVILTAGPMYASHPDPKSALESSYRNCLRLAKENNIQYIAFPAISCGFFGYPFDEAAKVAVSTVKEFGSDFKEIHFVPAAAAGYDALVKAANVLLQK